MQYLGNSFFGIWEKIFLGGRKTAKREMDSIKFVLFCKKISKACKDIRFMQRFPV